MYILLALLWHLASGPERRSGAAGRRADASAGRVPRTLAASCAIVLRSHRDCASMFPAKHEINQGDCSSQMLADRRCPLFFPSLALACASLVTPVNPAHTPANFNPPTVPLTH